MPDPADRVRALPRSNDFDINVTHCTEAVQWRLSSPASTDSFCNAPPNAVGFAGVGGRVFAVPCRVVCVTLLTF